MTRPTRFDTNLVVIGAGTGGLVSAYVAAMLKAKVALVESRRMGGDCLNTGCVPSKALIRSARLKKEIERAASFGIDCRPGATDFAAVMARVRQAIEAIEPHDSAARFRSLGVEVVRGHARLSSPWSVAITTGDGAPRTITTRSVVVATGAAPTVPAIAGLGDVGYLTSETVWQLAELPARLLVLGGGPIGCELAQAFARLGSRVTIVESAAHVLMREDADVAAVVADALRADGVELLTGRRPLRCERDGETRRLVLAPMEDEGETAIEFDRLLCAVGRTPRVADCGLEELGIRVSEKTRGIDIDAFLRTTHRHIYAVGDVAGPDQFTHTAAEQAATATVNALLGPLKRSRFDSAVIPWATFTDPEMARVGLSEAEAGEANVAFEVTRYDFDELDRAVTDGATVGFVKVLTVPGTDRILGATIVGERAGDLLAEFVLAMKHGLGLKKIFATIHVYPTFAEANRNAATQWREVHLPALLLRWAERYFAWRR